DLQKPHSHDEYYVFIRRAGKFQMGEEIIPFESDDFLFVPAGLPHRFLDFGDSPEAWIMFYGPEGSSK
ncbi:MAG: cupin domain-containing protein, partial [Candidatus Puniceispirillaceae bacterium]